MTAPAPAPLARFGLRATTLITVFSLFMMLLGPLAALAQDATPSPDTTGPVVSVPADISAEASLETGTAVVSFDVSAIDDVDGDLTSSVSCDKASGFAFPVGANEVTCSATDAAGNTGSASFFVYVSAAAQPTATTDPVEPTAINTTAPEPTATDTLAPEATSTTAPAEPTATTEPTNVITGPPTIKSDLEDYPPGGRVTLTGTNWQPGETVHITVNDDWGSSWKRDVDVVADADGNITDAFNLPDWFVATYSVVAAGQLSGTVRTSFTDGNVKVKSSAGVHFGFAKTIYSSTTCTSGPSATQNATGDSNGDTIGVGNTQSVRVVANLNANAPNTTATFSHWLNPDGLAISPSLTTRDICVVGFSGSGARDLVGVYVVNQAPSIARASAAVSVNEGSTATNTGTWSDVNAGDTVTLTASIGTVVKAGTNSAGTWSWSFGANDGPAQSQTVTITANDGNGGITTTTFNLTVNNVAPSATFLVPPSVPEGATFPVALTGPSDPSSVDTSAGFAYAFDCGSGYGTFSGVNSAPCAGSTDNGTRTVKGKIRDKDLAEREYTASVTILNVAPTASFPATASVNEGSSVTLAFINKADPSSVDVAAGFHFAFACNGASLAAATYAGSGTGDSITCTYPNGPSTQTVRARIIDKDGGSTEYTTAVTVNNVAPVANSQSVTTEEDSSVGLVLTASDPGADTLSYAIDSGPAHGTVTGTGASRSYTPVANYVGSDSFTFKVNDGTADSNIATVSITVTGVNDDPAAVDDDATVAEDSGATAIDVLGNDSIAPDTGETLSLTAATQGTNGSTSFTAAGVSYTPNSNFFGSDTFTYSISDGNGGSDSATVTVTVTAVNDAPMAISQSVSTNEDVELSFTLSASDVDNATVTFTVVDSPLHGTLSGVAPNLTYTPFANYHGPDSFTFTATDGALTSNLATVSITVNSINDAPLAGSATISPDPAYRNSSLTASYTGFADPDGDALTYSYQWYLNGLLVAGQITDTYTGPQNRDDVIKVVVTASDGSLAASAEDSLIIGNRAPVANSQSLSTDEDTDLPITLTWFDPDDDSVTFTLVDGPDHGTPSGTEPYLTYTPDPDYYGPDSFTFLVNDGALDSNLATVTIDVNPINDAPLAVLDLRTTFEDTPITFPATILLGNDSKGPMNESLQVLTVTAVAATASTHGTVELISGDITYTPDANFNGDAYFSYTICDDGNPVRCDTGIDKVHVEVAPVNDAPSFTVGADQIVLEDSGSQTVSGWATDILAGPANEGGQTVLFQVTDNTNPALFSVAPAVGSDGTLTYTLASDENGEADITITLQDDGGADNGGVDTSAPQTFTIAVTAVNDVPSFTKGADQSVAEDSGPRTVSAWATDLSVGPANESGQTLSFLVTNDNNDLFSAQPDIDPVTGTLTFTPGANANGIATVTVVLSDDGGASDGGDDTAEAQTFLITVTEVNDAPTAGDDNNSTDEDVALTFPATELLVNDVTGPANESGQSLTVTSVDNAVNGVVSLDAGQITFTPNPNYNGPASFTYTITDDGTTDGVADHLTATGTVNLTVIPVNDAPTVDVDSALVTFNEGETATNSGTFGDIDSGDTVTLSESTGSVVDNGDGTWSWSFDTTDGPDESRTVTITATDFDGLFATTTFELVVLNVDPTLTISGAATVAEGSNYTLNLFESDPGTDTITSWEITWGDGAVETVTSSPASVAHTYADGPANYTISATATDEDGTFNANSVDVEVTNVAPTATFNAPSSVNEGSDIALSLTGASDPGGANDPLTYAFDCGLGADYGAASTTSVASCPTTDDGARTVRGKVMDDDDGETEYIQIVTIDNVTPAVTAATDQTANEGSSTGFDLGSFADPGADAPWAVDVNWGDMSLASTFTQNEAGSLSSLFHTYADNGPYTVTVTVTDKDGAGASATFEVEVANVDPTALLSNNSPINEGSSATISFSDQSDPSAADLATLRYAFDCAGGNLDDVNYAVGVADASTICQFAQDGNFTVTGKVMDKDGGSSGYTTDVTVLNVAPTVDAGPDDNINEGGTFTSIASFTDPGADTWTVTINYGDSSAPVVVSGTTGADIPLSHTYLQDGVYTVNVSVADDDATMYDTAVVTVTNVAPVVDAGTDDTIDEGGTYTGGGSFSDPGADTWTATVDYGDGSAIQPLALSGMTFSLSHTYADDGLYSVTVTVFDDDASGADTVQVDVANVNPTVAADTATVTVNEGDTATNTGTDADAGADTVTVTASVGTVDDSGDGTWSWSYGTTDGPAQSGTVTITATDDDGGMSTTTFQLVVNNVAPVATFAAPASVQEGSSIGLILSAPSDPSSVDTTAGFTYEFDCGDGNGLVANGGNNAVSCPTTDNGTRAVVGRISDKDGGFTEYTASVTVTNADPVVSAGADDAINEGDTFTGGGSFTDAGSADTYTATVDYGDGSGVQPLALSGTSFSLSHLYTDNAVYTVSVTVTDDDGGVGSDTLTVTVSNVAPSATFGNTGPVNEGAPFSLSLTDPGDPSSDDTTAGFEYAFDCGSGAGFGMFSSASSVNCPTTDNGSRATKGKIRDKDGDVTEYTATVAVANVDPVTSSPVYTFDPVTHIATARFSFADAGSADTHAASFAWTVNGVTTSSPGTISGGVATSSRTLPTGCYTLTVVGTVTDDDGGSKVQTIATSQQADAYGAAFQAPIKDNERNLAKAGNVVPVKVSLTSSCTGASITNVMLFVQIVKGAAPGDMNYGDEVITTSVSAADSGQQMRLSGGGYIYNLSTKSLTNGQDYTIQIRLGSGAGPVILTAVLRTYK